MGFFGAAYAALYAAGLWCKTRRLRPILYWNAHDKRTVVCPAHDYEGTKPFAGGRRRVANAVLCSVSCETAALKQALNGRECRRATDLEVPERGPCREIDAIDGFVTENMSFGDWFAYRFDNNDFLGGMNAFRNSCGVFTIVMLIALLWNASPRNDTGRYITVTEVHSGGVIGKVVDLSKEHVWRRELAAYDSDVSHEVVGGTVIAVAQLSRELINVSYEGFDGRGVLGAIAPAADMKPGTIIFTRVHKVLMSENGGYRDQAVVISAGEARVLVSKGYFACSDQTRKQLFQ